MSSKRLLIVEDEYLVAFDLGQQLEQMGYEIVGHAVTEREAMSLCRSELPDLVLMDINLGSGGSGVEAARQILEELEIPVVYVTAYSSDELIERCGTTAPYGYVVKPYNIQELKAAIETALSRKAYELAMERSEKRLKAAVESADLAVWEFHRDQQNLIIEGKLAASFSRSKDGFLEIDAIEFFACLSEEDRKALEESLTNGGSVTRRLRLSVPDCLDGSVKGDETSRHLWVEFYFSQLTLEGGRVRIGAVRDVTGEVQQMRAMSLSSRILASIQEGVLVVDSELRVKAVNEAFMRTTGKKREDLLEASVENLIHHGRRRDDVSELLTRAQRESQTVLVNRKQGAPYDALLNSSRLDDLEDYDQLGPLTIMILTDVSRLKDAERQLSRLAFLDQLTGLGNRNYLNNLLQEIRVRPPERQKGALMFLDLDSFKLVNDTLGHDAGDQLLVEFSRRLRDLVRDNDHLIRLGGDEFVLFLEGADSQENVEPLAEKVIEISEKPFHVAGRELTVSCSVGIAFLTHESEASGQLLKQADIAMYEAKSRGKNNFVFFAPSQAKQSHYRLFVEQGVRQAIARNQICAWWQPLVDAVTGVPVGFEALCRWHDPEAGIIMPSDFIGVAEETGLIHLIGLKMLRDACIQMCMLEQEGFQSIGVSINVSSRQLVSPELIDVIIEAVEEASVSPTQVTLEVTESALHLGQAIKILTRLKDRGFRIAIDDFGTGYSSLSRLKDQPVDELKLDRSFLMGVHDDHHQKVIVESITRMGQDLGLEIVGEGVETHQQWAYCRGLGINRLQGYLFARPMPAADVLRFLQGSKPPSFPDPSLGGQP